MVNILTERVRHGLDIMAAAWRCGGIDDGDVDQAIAWIRGVEGVQVVDPDGRLELDHRSSGHFGASGRGRREGEVRNGG